MKKKRFFAAALCIMLLMTLLPSAALAGDNSVVVAGTDVSDGGYWTTGADGKLTACNVDDAYNVAYTPGVGSAPGVLMLNCANIIGSDDTSDTAEQGRKFAGIYASKPLKIQFTGSDNRISSVGGVGTTRETGTGCGIYIAGSGALTVKGTGLVCELTVTSTAYHDSRAIWADGGITFSGGTRVRANASKSDNNGIAATAKCCGVYSEGDISVSGCNLTATGFNCINNFGFGDSRGLHSNAGSITIDGGSTVAAVGGNVGGVDRDACITIGAYAKGTVTVMGSSSLEAVVGTVDYSTGVQGSYGVFAENSLRMAADSHLIANSVAGSDALALKTNQYQQLTGAQFWRDSRDAAWTLLDLTDFSASFPTRSYVEINQATRPMASDVTATGLTAAGKTLTGSYTYSNADGHSEGTSTYQWYSSSYASGAGKTPISGARERTYVLAGTDVGKYISFEVTPVSSAGAVSGAAVQSSPVGPIVSAPSASIGSITVLGTVGTAIAQKTATITLTADMFNALAANTDVSTWFTNLPAGLTAKISSTAA